MRTIKGIRNTITGIIAEQKNDKQENEIAENIIQYLFEEDNLVVPPKEDFDLRLKLFNDFYDWFSGQVDKKLKRSHFDEYLDSL